MRVLFLIILRENKESISLWLRKKTKKKPFINLEYFNQIKISKWVQY